MRQFGNRYVVTSVALLTALLCLGLAGCQADSKTPDRFDAGSDTSMDVEDDEPVESFLPQTRPDDAVCDGDWCWMYPTPFSETVEELRRVDDTVYGLADAPFIWGEQIRFVEVPETILDDADHFDMTVAADGWLALTDEDVVYEFGPQGVRDQYELPDGDYTFVAGHSSSLFMVGTRENGIYVRRDGSLTNIEGLEPRAETTRIWPNGQVWHVGESDQLPADPPEWLRTFPEPEVQQSTGSSANPQPLTLGPSPSAPCTDDSIWVGYLNKGFYLWDESSESWEKSQSLPNANVSDLTCRSDGALVVATAGQGILVNSGESWRGLTADILAGFQTVTTLDGTVYGGGGGPGSVTLVEATDSTLTRRGWRVLISGLSEVRSAFSDIWISNDESTALLTHSKGTDELTPDGARDVSANVERPHELGFGEALETEIWGVDEPAYAISKDYVLRWDGSGWTETRLTSSRDAEFMPIDIVGQAADDVMVATSDKIFHYDGRTWRVASGSLDTSDSSITRMLAESDGSYLVAVGSEIHRLSGETRAWQTELVQMAPCDDITALHRDPEGALWVGGPPHCVARSTDDGWEVFEPSAAVRAQQPDQNSRRPQDVAIEPGHFVQQPDSDMPLFGNRRGIMEPRPDGTLGLEYRHPVFDIVYMPDHNATVAVTRSGILARYH